MKKYQVFGIGNALVDIVTEVEDDFFKTHRVEKGLMTLVDEARQQELMEALKTHAWKLAGGGSAANTIMAIAQLGGNCSYTCVVANDELGKYFLDDLSRAGVDLNLTSESSPKGATGRCLVMVSPDTQRTMNTFLGISTNLSPEYIRVEKLEQSDWIYMEGYLVSTPQGLETIKQAVKLAKEKNVKVAFSFSDLSMVKYFSQQVNEIVTLGIDLLFCNEEEAMLFTQTNSLKEACESLQKSVNHFAVTRGANGAQVFDGKSILDIEPVRVNAVDTNGAGDMFAGAFMYAISHGKTMNEAGRLASQASAKVVTTYGPRLSVEEMEYIKNEM